MAPETRSEHARQFLAGLILVILAGAATVWFLVGFWLALSYASGAATVLLFAKVAPSWHPRTEDDADHQPGFQ